MLVTIAVSILYNFLQPNLLKGIAEFRVIATGFNYRKSCVESLPPVWFEFIFDIFVLYNILTRKY